MNYLCLRSSDELPCSYRTTFWVCMAMHGWRILQKCPRPLCWCHRDHIVSSVGLTLVAQMKGCALILGLIQVLCKILKNIKSTHSMPFFCPSVVQLHPSHSAEGERSSHPGGAAALWLWQGGPSCGHRSAQPVHWSPQQGSNRYKQLAKPHSCCWCYFGWLLQ